MRRFPWRRPPDSIPIPSGELWSRLHNLLVQELKVPLSAVRPEATFAEDLGIDSLQSVELVMALEEAFRIEIPDEDEEKLKTVRDVYDYLVRTRGGKP